MYFSWNYKKLKFFLNIWKFSDMLLETDDIAFMLVQYEHEAESTTVAASTSES